MEETGCGLPRMANGVRQHQSACCTHLAANSSAAAAAACSADMASSTRGVHLESHNVLPLTLLCVATAQLQQLHKSLQKKE